VFGSKFAVGQRPDLIQPGEAPQEPEKMRIRAVGPSLQVIYGLARAFSPYTHFRRTQGVALGWLELAPLALKKLRKNHTEHYWRDTRPPAGRYRAADRFLFQPFHC
jgi:hypothetical protein